MKNSFGNNLSIINLHKKKSIKSSLDTQLLYGDNFKLIKKYNGWQKIRINKDGYIGYIKNEKFPKPITFPKKTIASSFLKFSKINLYIELKDSILE